MAWLATAMGEVGLWAASFLLTDMLGKMQLLILWPHPTLPTIQNCGQLLSFLPFLDDLYVILPGQPPATYVEPLP